jgi:hypothetical protein
LDRLSKRTKTGDHETLPEGGSMSSRQRRSTHRAAIWCQLLVLALVAASPAAGQTVEGDLFSHVQTLTLLDGSPVSGSVSLHGDTAVVGADGVAYVFERKRSADLFLETARLVPSDGASGFGQSVANHGRTIVVGADGAAYVFRRRANGTWREITKLTGDMNPGSFGVSVAVRHGTIVVGAPWPDTAAGERGPGVAYVFDRHHGGPNAWGEIARLGPATLPPGTIDAFGTSVAIDRDTAVVGAFSPRTIPDGFHGGSSAFVFSRDHGGPDAWDMVAELPLGLGPDTGPAQVSISDDTAVATALRLSMRVFERDRGGPDAWEGQIVGGAAWDVGISGNLLAVHPRSTSPPITTILARHQGGQDAWGPVARIGPRRDQPPSLAINHDTLVLGFLRGGSTIEPVPLSVYVADTDRDGIRDSVDLCPRDPLNSGSCQRASAVHPNLDDLIVVDEVTSDVQNRRQIITATFTNTSATAVRNPFFEVTELTGGNILLNADEGRGGIGATLSPDVGDGVLSPGESLTVTFWIRLRTNDPFQFFVAFHGDQIP